jgi:hypothetical protein
MITVTVHEPPSPPADRLDRADRLAFVKDGYNWLAAAWPPLWMLAQRLWIALLAYVVVAAALSLGLSALGLPATVTALVFLGLHLLIGLEADTIMRWNLDRSGWQVVGTVVASHRRTGVHIRQDYVRPQCPPPAIRNGQGSNA